MFISNGNLIYPNEDLINAIMVLEAEFYKLNGPSLISEKFIIKKLAARIMSSLKTSNISYDVIYYLSKVRTYIRLRDMNRQISFKNCTKKLQYKVNKYIL